MSTAEEKQNTTEKGDLKTELIKTLVEDFQKRLVNIDGLSAQQQAKLIELLKDDSISATKILDALNRKEKQSK